MYVRRKPHLNSKTPCKKKTSLKKERGLGIVT